MKRFSLLAFVLGAKLLPAQAVSFVREVQPILAERCVVCHSAKNGAAEVSLASYAQVAANVVAGKLDESMLSIVVSGEKPSMPKVGGPLKPQEVELIRRWIAEGARDDSAGKKLDETWWSLRPLDKPPLPELAGRTVVDRFIAAKLREKGLVPSPEADRRTLIRRLTFDLHGLPPTPAEVVAFERDRSPDAYEKLVDRLLASPRYGERWARHWLDVVHYGDSHGYDKDKPRPNAWPYRDAVIRAFNEDVPYARFVQEQIAGDVLYAGNARAFEATGFLAAGPWDFVGHQELREGTMDKALAAVRFSPLSLEEFIAGHSMRLFEIHRKSFSPLSLEEFIAGSNVIGCGRNEFEFQSSIARGIYCWAWNDWSEAERESCFSPLSLEEFIAGCVFDQH